MDIPRYPHKPIHSLASLGKALQVRPAELERIARTAPKLYPLSKSKGIVRKLDGTVRIFYAPEPPIKNVQREIHSQILRCVDFPTYLIGGLKGYSYRDNCLLHTRARTVVNLDINTFFESVTSTQIESVWRRFFQFTPDVSELLTRLTTHRGALPRGAPTSPLLANLVFWNVEPDLVLKLSKSGIRYSRYVDDVTLSSKRRLAKKTIGWANRHITQMLQAKGLSLNRLKTRISRAPSPLRVHDVNVRGKVPTIPKKVRREIRADVHNLAHNVYVLSSPAEKLARFRHVNGRVSWLHQFHPEEAAALWAKLLVLDS